MVILNKATTPRFEYIARFLMEDICGFSVRVTDIDPQGEACIVYADEEPSFPAVHIVPHGLVSEKGIRPQDIEMDLWESMPCFFVTGGEIPFDIFSASFYLVSRYEEYTDQRKDAYGRYDHRNSLAFRNNFLDQPIVEMWALKFRQFILRKFPSEPYRFRKFRFMPSYDIDQAWCYLHKGFIRNAGGLMRSFLTGDLKTVAQRISVLRGKTTDPYEIYEWLDAIHLKYSLRPYYFFPLATSSEGYDKNISPLKQPLRDLVNYHAAGYKTGIHPSWRSGDNNQVFKQELESFMDITGSLPMYNRFHYIRFNLPDDYRKLIGYGIMEDHSMGYGSINGFRASVTAAFYWYDVLADKLTDLRVQPFCWMDANSYYEQGFSAAQAFEELKHYHDAVKTVEGTLITISHNNFLSTELGFAGWKQVYEIFLDEVVYWDL
jgi:hypothetical protein